MKIQLLISDYSEWVVRKALYWCSPKGNWTLISEGDCWVITIDENSKDFESELHRHLNDFILREKLDRKTSGLREQVVVAALKAILKSYN